MRPKNCKTCGGKMEDGGTMSNFGKAFSAARKQGLKVFEWNGKQYTTELKEEQEARQAPINSENSKRLKSLFATRPVETAPVKPPVTAPPKKEGPMIGLQPSDADGTRIGNAFRGIPVKRTTTPPPAAPPPAKKPTAPAQETKAPTKASPPTTGFMKGMLQGDTGWRPTPPTEQKPVASVNNPTTLQSGMVFDKRKNQGYIVQNGKVVKQIPIITGKNQDMNSNIFSMEELEANPMLRNTPVGAYSLKPTDDAYGYKGYDMEPIQFKGETPEAESLLVHRTFPKERAIREAAYNTDHANMSWGCVNTKEGCIDQMYKYFPQGDTAIVIDPKIGRTLQSLGIKQKQDGGPMMIDPKLFKPKEEISPSEIPYLEPDKKPSPYLDRIEEGTEQGVLEAKRADGSDEQRTAKQQYWDYKGIPEARRLPGTPLNWKRNLGIGMMGVRSLLSEISGRVARGRQNQYDYDQQAMLGMLNPMQPQQPNPYSLYAKYGGKLKSYMQTGGPNINQSVYDGQDDLVAMLTMKRRLANAQLEMSKTPPVPQGKTPYSVSYPIPTGQGVTYFNNIDEWNAHMQGKQYVNQQIAGDRSSASASLYGPQKYGGLLHAKYFGPKFSNKANYKFSEREQFDKVVVTRSIVPDLILRKNWGNKRIYRKKEGGIHIKPENKGKFTDYCGGKVTGDCIEKGLDSPSATIRKRANFARNARKWNK